MSKKLFTEIEIKKLSNNPYVKSVSSKGVTYTDEFKRLFIAETEIGKFPRTGFRGVGTSEANATITGDANPGNGATWTIGGTNPYTVGILIGL